MLPRQEHQKYTIGKKNFLLGGENYGKYERRNLAFSSTLPQCYRQIHCIHRTLLATLVCLPLELPVLPCSNITSCLKRSSSMNRKIATEITVTAITIISNLQSESEKCLTLSAFPLPVWSSLHSLITFYKILYFYFCLSIIKVAGLNKKKNLIGSPRYQ